MKLALGVLVVLGLGACAAGPKEVTAPAQGEGAADLVFVGGTVWTMDPLKPKADGVAITDGHVDFVGSDAEVRRHVGPRTRVVELAGRSLSPGLVDAHCHLYGLGEDLESLDVRALTSTDAVTAKVREAAAKRQPSEWVEGRGWDQNLWPVKEFPPGGLMDDVPNPVSLRRIDGHSMWVNKAALKAAGIDRKTDNPSGGRIVRDAKGEATGVLVDAAMGLVDRVRPVADESVITRRLLAAQDVAVADGLTGVHDMGLDDDVIAVYRKLAGDGRLKLRVYAMIAGGTHVEKLATTHPDRDPDGTAIFVLGGAKFYADGSLGSRSAALLASYSDEPKNSGLILNDVAHLTTAARNGLAGGWQIAVHAIGDRGNRNVLDAFRDAGVPPSRRFRIEHAQVVAPDDFARFASQGIIASMQPTHATSDMPFAEARVGSERVRGAYAWRTMLSAGVHLAFGSDFPVEEVPPIDGLYAAISRQDKSGKPAGGWYPDQRVTLDEALRGYTVEAAYAAFQESHRGKLAPGYVADVTVYDRNLTPETVRDAKVAMTVVGGRVVYDGAR